MTAKRFAKRDRESLKWWFQGALVPHPLDCFSVTLGCPPEFEAAFSCGPPLWLSDETHARLSCPVLVHYAENTRLFQPQVFADLVERYPNTYRFAGLLIKGCTHLMAVEDPNTVRARRRCLLRSSRSWLHLSVFIGFDELVVVQTVDGMQPCGSRPNA